VQLETHIAANVPLGIAYEGFFKSKPLRVKVHRDIVAFNVTENEQFVIGNLFTYKYANHSRGLCGTPFLLKKNKGVCIAGFHVGFLENECFSLIFDKETILRGMLKLQSDSVLFPIASEGAIAEIGELEDPVSKSPFRHEHLAGIHYFGKLKGDIHMNQKSSLVKTRIYDDVEEIFDEEGFVLGTKFNKPMMKPGIAENGWTSPWNNALREISAQRGFLNRKVMRKVVTLLSTRILKELRKRKVPKWSPLDVETAINGAEQDPFIRRVNASTSGGFGFKGLKRDFLPLTDDTTREPNEVLKERILKILNTYEKGDTFCVVNSAQLKDEPREESKCKSGKTRVFYMTPLDFLIVSRMFLSPFYSSMVEHGDIFGTCVGINMFTGAEKLYADLGSFSPCIMEGDYKSFDQRMPFDIGYAASSVVYNVLKGMGYNSFALLIVSGILTEMLFPFILMNLDLMMCPGLQPSGRYATAEDNSLRGLIMLMVAWYTFRETKNLDFFLYVLVRLYGDDMLASVKPEVAPFFNNLTYKGFCEKIYLLGFTSPNKSSQMDPFTTIDECSFLKRTFLWRDDLKRHTAILDPSSIARSLQWLIPSRHVPIEEQLKGSLVSSLWELFQHCRREQFNRIREKLCALVSENYFMGENILIPTYEEIDERIIVHVDVPNGLPEVFVM